MKPSPQRESAPQAPSTNLKRRRFLLALGAGSAGAAASAAPIAVQAVDSAADSSASKGYQETEHVRDYYASARL